MMRLWRDSYARPRPALASTTLSVVVHLLLIAAAVIATLPTATLDDRSIANHLYYIPPPNRPHVPAGGHETLQFVELSAPGPASGPGPGTFNAGEPATAHPISREVGDSGVAPVTAPPAAGAHGQDSVFTEIEVDTAVTRSENSAAPAYPLELIKNGIEGSVLVRYVVDTTGFADSTSLEIIKTTHPGFADAVRAAIPYMRFHPARIGVQKVRQLVEQPFTFRIQGQAGQPTNAKRPTSPRR